jgi:hypothetical protein
VVSARATVASLVALAGLAAGCGGGTSLSIREPDPPVGEPQLPDIAPAPALDVRMTRADGRWRIRFSTILVNIGQGDFVLRARRDAGEWAVVQDIVHSRGGARVVRSPAQMVWGGDGHEHWHIQRIAVNRLVPFDESGPPSRDRGGWVDAKVGFCFYDFSPQLHDAVHEAVYARQSCGREDHDAIGMGLSRGWADVYPFGLPGQSVDVTDLPDGRYRLWTEADPDRWFRESRRDNNRTWVDVALATGGNGARTVRITRTGPPIRPEE